MFASETVEITGIGHIRYQECDRFAAILTNLKAMGIACEQLDENRIVIHPGKPHGCKIKRSRITGLRWLLQFRDL